MYVFRLYETEKEWCLDLIKISGAQSLISIAGCVGSIFAMKMMKRSFTGATGGKPGQDIALDRLC